MKKAGYTEEPLKLDKKWECLSMTVSSGMADGI